jgi:ribosome maturation factor RimP
VGFAAHLFYGRSGGEDIVTDTIQRDIETRLAGVEPDVEVLLAERVGGATVKLVIDSPDGVDLGTCERVTNHLRDLLNDVGLEVSSPGPERPLTKPEHFRRFLGRRVRVRTRAPRDGRKSFTGELVGASDEEVTVAAADAGVVSIPYSQIGRSNVVADSRGERPMTPNPSANPRGS